MTRGLRWIVVSVGGVALFVVVWWLAEAVFGLDRGTAQAFAGLAVGLFTLPAGWWFAQAPTSRDERPGNKLIPTAVAVLIVLAVGVVALNPWGSPGGPGSEERLTVNKAGWYAGLKVIIGAVTYDPARDPSLIAEVRLENQATEDYDPAGFDVTFKSGDQSAVGRITESNPVPALATSGYHVGFEVDRLDGGLGAGTFFFGEGDEAQTVVPVGPGELIANEPRTVVGKKTITTRDLSLTFTTCQVRADFLRPPHQTGKDQHVLGCFFDIRLTTGGLHWFGTRHIRLRLPDGTSVSAAEPPYELLQDGAVIRGVYVGFSFSWPMPGKYLLQVLDPHDDEAPSAANTYNLPFTV